MGLDDWRGRQRRDTPDVVERVVSKAKEVPTEPYSLENLARIINALAIKGLPVLESKDIELSIEHANANTGRSSISSAGFRGWPLSFC